LICCALDDEGCEESEEANKAGHGDVSSWFAGLQASESRSTAATAAVQTTRSYQGCETDIASSCVVTNIDQTTDRQSACTALCTPG